MFLTCTVSRMPCMKNVSKHRSIKIKCEAAEPQSNTASSWVFQAQPPRGNHYTLLDVRDAVETCSAIKSADEKEQCYLNFGLDSHAVEEYYDPVMKMEEAVQERSNEQNDILAQKMVKVGGFLLVLMFGARLI
ncbi:hypothetical protein CEUSTIGMA_g5722.t1 [Chlamydomonas eustigma]|uniref:Uncharacterized protein n=1 Tax=Chlamydomonas eustigma TaxID=1157962 RepID=A0A250X680_9CHLO|nr:hypothetical protein CEUSTIGMA_g5722.t1 [Chlamydomonas eustigma]|eukprot:GAX78280.1 hypothetical protein CEUSTIGMA_g5722.t1 [Chlamydomonas eustigma]